MGRYISTRSYKLWHLSVCIVDMGKQIAVFNDYFKQGKGKLETLHCLTAFYK